MREPNDRSNDGHPHVGSLFSGYGGLDLAVEQVFDARTVWFSEINEPVARVFAHHWPGAPNLGDITTINWSSALPVDILCGGFPCQDVSTVGKMAGLVPAPAPVSGRTWRTPSRRCSPTTWSSRTSEGCCPRRHAEQCRKETSMNDTTPIPQPSRVQPFAVWNPTRGVWETSQPDLYRRLAPYSETWPTSGMTHDGSAYPLRRSAHLIPGSASSSSPTALFRTPLASDSARGGETLAQVKARRGTIALSHQVIDLVTRHGRPSPQATFALIEEFFDAGDATPPPSPDGNARHRTTRTGTRHPERGRDSAAGTRVR